MALEFARRGLAVKVITSGQPPAPVRPEDRPPYALEYTSLRAFRSLWHIDRLTRDCAVVHVQYQAAAFGMTLPVHLLPRYFRRRAPGRKVFVTFHDLKVPYLFPKAGRLRWR